MSYYGLQKSRLRHHPLKDKKSQFDCSIIINRSDTKKHKSEIYIYIYEINITLIFIKNQLTKFQEEISTGS